MVHCPFCRHDDSRVVDSRAADVAGAASAPVSPGTETLSVTATVVFAIG